MRTSVSGVLQLVPAGRRYHTPLAVLVQQLQDVGEHDVGSVESPDEVQMFPVLDVLMEDQLRHLDTENQLPVAAVISTPKPGLRTVQVQRSRVLIALYKRSRC